MNKRTILILLGFIVIVSGACFYFTPYWAVSNMKEAAENNDAEALSDYVDYPAFKESLKANFNAMMVSEASSKMSDNPFAAFGAALAAIVINPMIDNLVTPEGLAMLMQGEKPQLEKGQSNSKTPQPSDGGDGGKTETSMSYDNFNRFFVTVRNKDTIQESIQLIFKRHGIISWKLSAFRLPKGNEEKTTQPVSDSGKTDTTSDKAKIVATKPIEPEKSLLTPTLTNKRFQKSNFSEEIYEDNMWFDITWDTSRLEKPTRAVKGVLIVGDIFGEPKFRLRYTINEPLSPGKSYKQNGIGFDYNQFIDRHKWFRSTELKDMTFRFEVEDIIYQDGTKKTKPVPPDT